MNKSLSFSFPSGDDAKRQSFRVVFEGLRVILAGESYQVHDLSISGLSFSKSKEMKLFAGDVHTVHIAVASRIYISDISLEIIRVMPDMRVACRFVKVTPQQSARLDKLILEAQKLSIGHPK